MTGYSAVVRSIMERGPDVYQVTIEIYPPKTGQKPQFETQGGNQGQFLVHRVDIVIEGDRTILFPDRELDECMDAYFEMDEFDSHVKGIERQWMIGKTVERICREVSTYLFEIRSAEAIAA